MGAGHRQDEQIIILLKSARSDHLLRNKIILVALPVPQAHQRTDKYLLPDPDCDMYLFKKGVKPMWEDINNVGGGCFKIKI